MPAPTKPTKLIHLSRLSWVKLRAAAVMLAVVTLGYIITRTMAAGPLVAFEPESGTLSGAAKVAALTGASGGSVVQFGPGATPTPAPSPAPTSTPAPSSRCPAYPAFPDAACTGVPAGTSLSPSGSLTVTQDNTVINGLDINGGITVSAKNVTIKNTRVRTSDDRYTLKITAGASAIVTDSEFGRTGGYNTAATYPSVYQDYNTSLTITRGNFYGGADIFKVDSNFTLRDSYIHDPYHAAGMHSDLMQIKYSSSAKEFKNITIAHNTLLAKSPTTGDNVNSAIIRSSANEYVTNLLFEQNYLNGGNYTVYCPADSRNTSAIFRSNKFGRNAQYGPATGCDPPYIQWSNTNVYLDSGLPVLP